ncbi:ATP-binding protein [Acetonema longum]|nr:GAF domain-containing sensor histidine kinase [Acetonema longum]
MGRDKRVIEKKLLASDLLADVAVCQQRIAELELSEAQLLTEVDQRKQTEAELIRQNFYLHLLQETAVALIDHHNWEKLLVTILKQAAALINTEDGFLFLVDSEGQKLKLKFGLGIYEPMTWLSLAKGEALGGRVWQTGEPLVVHDYANWSNRVQGAYWDSVAAVAGVPLRTGDQIVGVLGLAHCKAGKKFARDELTYLCRFAELASVALANANLYQSLQRELEERRQVEAALRQSEERYRLLFNHITDAVLIWDIQADGTPGRFLEVNEVACKRLGYTRPELMELTPLDICKGSSCEEFAAIIKTLEQQHSALVDLLQVSKSGKIIPTESHVQLFYLEGKPAVLSIARDVSERKFLEKEMARFERLHLIGELAASIGHEVRNPLTTIRGFLQIMRGKAQENREYYDIMIDELDRANSIITEFLSLAKSKSIELEVHNLNDVIRMLAPLIQANAIVENKSVSMDLGQIPDLLLNEKEIRQMILNIARNGIEAMQPGKNLTIRTRAEGDEVLLSIIDQGCGISRECIEKLGTPFFTTKEHGTGLGLAVCFSIAHRHNATIQVESSDHGTTFYIRFHIGSH